MYQSISDNVSQGDILELAPHIYLDPPLSALAAAEAPGTYLASQVPPSILNGDPVIASCKRRLAIVVTFDCEIDKPMNERWIVCPVVPLSDLPSQSHGNVKRNRVAKLFFLQRHKELIPDSVVVLDQLSTINRFFIKEAVRIATLSDDGRLGLYTQFIRWLTRWEFKDVKCPNCKTEFNPTLGMSVRP